MSALDLAQLGQRLRTARGQAALSQTEAAQALDVTPAALSQYEAGKRRVDAVTLDRLSRLYGVPVTFFFQPEPPEPAAEWESALRAVARDLSAHAKAGVGTLIERVRALEELFERTGTPFPGLSHPPFAPLPAAPFSEYEIREHADRVRHHFALGHAPMHDMKGFLETHGYLVFTVPLGQGRDVISGLYFQHPRLGKVAVISEDQAYTRWPFTLAHEFAHGLYHYDRPAILCRRHDEHPVEQFANAFAGYFLVPTEALHEQLRNLGTKTVGSAEDAVKLGRYFGISFRAMCHRLESERRLNLDPQVLNATRPVTLAKSLGFQTTPYEFGARPLPIEERFPRVFLQLGYQAIRDEVLSARRVADLLGVSHLELEERLHPDDPVEEPEEVSA